MTRPSRRGFGYFLIENLVAQAVNGEVATDFDASGLRWTLSMPSSNLISDAGLAH